MHIRDGMLSPPVLIGGAVLAGAAVIVGLAKMRGEDVPRVGVLSSVFFAVSLIQFPLGPSCVHLVLCGLIGIVLRWKAFPAVLVALFLQAMIFQVGGFTTLGVNTFVMAAPAVLAGLVFRPVVLKSERGALVGGFLAGTLAVLAAALLTALALLLSSDSYSAYAALMLAAHLPVLAIEGIVCATCIGFLRKVKPEILGGTYI